MIPSIIKEETPSREIDTPRFKESKIDDPNSEMSDKYEGEDHDLLKSDLDDVLYHDLETPESTDERHDNKMGGPSFLHSSAHHKMIYKRKGSKKSARKVEGVHHKCNTKISDIKQENDMLKSMIDQYEKKIRVYEKQLDDMKRSTNCKKGSQVEVLTRKNVPHELTLKKDPYFGSFHNSNVIDNNVSKDHSINSDSDTGCKNEPVTSAKNYDISSVKEKIEFVDQVFRSFDRVKKECMRQQEQILSMQSIIESYQEKVIQFQTLVSYYDSRVSALLTNYEDLNSQFMYVMKTIQNKHMNMVYGVESHQNSSECLNSLLSDDVMKRAYSEKHCDTNLKLTKNKTQHNLERVRPSYHTKEERRMEQQTMTPQHKKPSFRKSAVETQKDTKHRPRPSFNIEKKKSIIDEKHKSATDNSLLYEDIYGDNTPIKSIESVHLELADNDDEGMDIFHYIEKLKNKYKEEKSASNLRIEYLSSILNNMYLILLQFHNQLRNQRVEIGTLKIPQLRYSSITKNDKIYSKMNSTVDSFNTILANIEYETLIISYKKSYTLLEQVISSMKVDIHDKIKKSIDDSMTMISDVINKRTSDVYTVESRFNDLVEKIARLNEDSNSSINIHRSHSNTMKKISDKEQIEYNKQVHTFKKTIGAKFREFFSSVILPSQNSADHFGLSMVNFTEKSFNILEYLMSHYNDTVTYVKTLLDNYKRDVIESNTKRSDIDGVLDKKYFDKLVSQQTKMHSVIVHKVEMFILESMHVIFQTNEYNISQPNFGNNLKIFRKQLNDLKSLLKQYNTVDMKAFNNMSQISKVFDDGALETLQSCIVQDGSRYKFIFSYEIVFIDMLISTWLSLFI